MAWLVLAAVTASAVAFLFVPLDLSLRVEARGVFRFHYSVTWLFGLLRREGDVHSGRDEGADRRGRALARRRVWAAVRSPGFSRRGLVLLGRLLRRVHVRELRAIARFGTEDPADTGQLYGALLPILAPLRALPVATLEIEPDFEHNAICGTGVLAVRVLPIIVLSGVGNLLLSPVGLRAVRRVRRA